MPQRLSREVIVLSQRMTMSTVGGPAALSPSMSIRHRPELMTSPITSRFVASILRCRLEGVADARDVSTFPQLRLCRGARLRSVPLTPDSARRDGRLTISARRQLHDAQSSALLARRAFAAAPTARLLTR